MSVSNPKAFYLGSLLSNDKAAVIWQLSLFVPSQVGTVAYETPNEIVKYFNIFEFINIIS